MSSILALELNQSRSIAFAEASIRVDPDDAVEVFFLVAQTQGVAQKVKLSQLTSPNEGFANVGANDVDMSSSNSHAVRTQPLVL